MKKLLILLLTVWVGVACGGASTIKGVEFARVAGRPLLLDLYVPEKGASGPLVVYMHGGAWRAGTRAEMPLGALVGKGFAVASVDYRLSTEAQFPAQVHDIKAAIRYLRVHAVEHGIDASVIVIAGSSAGAHLAALVGVSNGGRELEGAVGAERSASSDVQGILSLFGASNLESILGQSSEHGRSVRVPALGLLLGGQPDGKRELARLASPVAHVDANDPPLLLIHGDADPQMPFEQSVELERAYKAAKLPVQFEVIHGGKHGGAEFHDAQRSALMEEFLRSIRARGGR